MIRTALEFVKTELSSYCFNKEPDIYTSIADVVNISGFYAPNGASTIDLNKHLQLTLINLEEERLEGVRPYYIPNEDKITQLKAPVTINMYLLFVATFPNYLTSLHDIASIISFFQINQTFHKDKYPNMNTTIADPMNRPWRLIERLDFNIHSLTLEQQNNIWAALGTKHLPHIMYKVRMLSFFDRQGEVAEPIVEVGLDSRVN